MKTIAALNQSCDWIKVRTYPRVFGPARLPFKQIQGDLAACQNADVWHIPQKYISASDAYAGT
ncbi:MAG TPA: hypothetical protein VK206_20715 [Anaerolineales bacterium]|nr:hypothetical protein [Anaerolineales bacterium]HLO28262.1 hypothetical protein [Anaerolineales bacterium]